MPSFRPRSINLTSAKCRFNQLLASKVWDSDEQLLSSLMEDKSTVDWTYFSTEWCLLLWGQAVIQSIIHHIHIKTAGTGAVDSNFKFGDITSYQCCVYLKRRKQLMKRIVPLNLIFGAGFEFATTNHVEMNGWKAPERPLNRLSGTWFANDNKVLLFFFPVILRVD